MRDPLVPDDVYEWANGYSKSQRRDRDSITLYPSPPHTAGDVRLLLKTNFSWQVLHDLLIEKPRMIGHPVVAGLVRHLRHRSEDPYTGGEAESVLVHVLGGWLGSVLPGWKLRRQKLPGRTIDPWTEDSHRGVLEQYQLVLKELQKFKNNSQLHSPDQVARAIKKLWSGSKNADGLGSSMRLSSKGIFRRSRIQLPDATVRSWASNYLNHRKGVTFLVYNMLGHKYSLRYDQVRHIVQQTRSL